MATARTITAANSVFMLSVTGLFNSPQQLTGFSADDVFDSEAIDKAETMMGVDGHMAAGFVFTPIEQGITLMADSYSNDIFEQWMRAQDAARDLYFAQGSIIQPSINKAYTLTRGVLISYPVFADTKKVLQPRKYRMRWESVSPAVI